MAKQTDPDEDDLSDFDFDDSIGDFDEFDADTKLFDDTIPDETLAEAPPSSENQANEFSISDEEGELKDPDPSLEHPETEQASVTETESPSEKEFSSLIPPEELEPITPDAIPLQIKVEIGRIQMPIHQLLQLEPGNMLTLSTLPEKEVNLTVNQKMIGRGELIQIGENLGVRILKLGKD